MSKDRHNLQTYLHSINVFNGNLPSMSIRMLHGRSEVEVEDEDDAAADDDDDDFIINFLSSDC